MSRSAGGFRPRGPDVRDPGGGRDAVAMPSYPRSGCYAVLTDGRGVRIRPVMPEDRTALRALHEGASGQSTYQRFFIRSRVVAEQYAGRVCAGADDGHWVVIAELGGKPAAVGDCYRAPGSAEAEIAVLVADEYQHDGIGTLLMAHLVAWARRAGIRRFVAEVLTSDMHGQDILRRPGFRVDPRPAGGVTAMVHETAADRTGRPGASFADHALPAVAGIPAVPGCRRGGRPGCAR